MRSSLSISLILSLSASGATFAKEQNYILASGSAVAQKYQEECGACHFAYDARFLPARSWEKIMASLDKHFNENAELAAIDKQLIETYLKDNARDQRERNMRGVQKLARTDTPLRISDTSYFKSWHHEVPSNVFNNNPGVKNFSQCKACHTTADKGNFDEDNVRIPGFAHWD